MSWIDCLFTIKYAYAKFIYTGYNGLATNEMANPPLFNFGLSVQENAAILGIRGAKKFLSDDPKVQCERLSTGPRIVTFLLRVKDTELLYRYYLMKKALTDYPGILQPEGG